MSTIINWELSENSGKDRYNNVYELYSGVLEATVSIRYEEGTPPAVQVKLNNETTVELYKGETREVTGRQITIATNTPPAKGQAEYLRIDNKAVRFPGPIIPPPEVPEGGTKWDLVNKATKDGAETVYYEIYSGVTARSFYVYYRGGTIEKNPTYPDVAFDIDQGGPVLNTSVGLYPNKGKVVNGFNIKLRTGHAFAHAWGYFMDSGAG